MLQIEFLEVRLAEVMAYADIPINMRPALTELTNGSMSALAAAGIAGGQGSHAGHLQHLLSGLSTQTDGSNSNRAAKTTATAAGVAGGIKATQVELVRGALLGCLKMLRQMSEALGESVHGQLNWMLAGTTCVITLWVTLMMQGLAHLQATHVPPSCASGQSGSDLLSVTHRV